MVTYVLSPKYSVKKGKGSPYSIAKHRVPGLILVFGSQPAGDVSHKPGSRLTQTHTHPFNDPLSGTTRVSRYQKGKPISILLNQETVSGSGISWAICKSAPRSRQITMPAPHHSVFYRPDALPAAQPTVSKH